MSGAAPYIEKRDFYIGGEWVPARSRATIEVLEAASEAPLGRVPDASTEDVDAAVAAARRAFDQGPFPDWTPNERAGPDHAPVEGADGARPEDRRDDLARERLPGAAVDGRAGDLVDAGARRIRRTRAQLRLRQRARRRARQSRARAPRAGGRLRRGGAVERAALRLGLAGARREAGAQSGELHAGSGETEIFITPGYHFRVVDALITNFHLPKSTLLMLVSAFAGLEPIRAAYVHAIAERYRFFSYGDAMFLEKRPPE